LPISDGSGYLPGKLQQHADGAVSEVKEIQLQDMAPLRALSQTISQFLHKRLGSYLATLTPLLAPRKILGEYMQSAFKEKMPGADKSFAELEERYKAIGRDTFKLASKLATPLPNIKNQLEVYPWEYLYEVGGQKVVITSPVRWVIAYRGLLDLPRLLEGSLQGEKPGPDELKQFIVNALVLRMLLERSAGVRQVLEDLRFPLRFETCSVSGELPYVVACATVPSFRPQDEIIRTVTQLSGRPVFEELVDVESVDDLPDPFKDRIRELAENH
jgi:hypothetical protein